MNNDIEFSHCIFLSFETFLRLYHPYPV
jgi:hypothetical protein